MVEINRPIEYKGFYIEQQKDMFGIYFHNSFLRRAESIAEAQTYIDFYHNALFLHEETKQ